VIFALLVALALAGWLFSDYLSLGSEVVVYGVRCPPDAIQGNSCKAMPMTASSETYRALPAQQAVLHWWAGMSPR
jgi:hypothetical protein